MVCRCISRVRSNFSSGLLFTRRTSRKCFCSDRSIDVKMTSKNGKKSDTLCASSEIREDPGLISTMSQMTNNPVILVISPTLVRVTEMKMQLSTSQIQDLIGERDDQRTMFVLLADDGSGKSLSTNTEKCNYWFNHFSKKNSFPPVEFDLSEDETFPCHAILSSIRKPTITPRTTPIRFPVDFF